MNPTKRPAEWAAGSVGLVASVVIGVLEENTGIEIGPWTTMGIVLLVGLVAPFTTWLVERAKR